MFAPSFRRMAYPFFKSLLPYLKASLPLPDALQLTGKQIPTLSFFANRLFDLVQQGYRLSLAVEILGAPKALIEWIQTGEESGQFIPALEAALTLHQTRKTLQKTWAGILRYPVSVLVFMILTIFILHSTVFPSLIKFYGEKPLPFLTNFLFHYPGLSSGLLLLFPALMSFFLIPFKRLQNLLNLCETLTIKLGAGIPLTQAAPQTWRSLLSHGYHLSIILTLQNEDPFLTHLVKTGETTGNLYDSFVQAKKFYQEKSLLYFERLQAYLPPILMIMMASFVGLLVMSVYLPLLNLSF